MYILGECLIKITKLTWKFHFTFTIKLKTFFRKLRLVDTAKLQEHHSAFELPEFQATIRRHIDNAKAILMDKYFAGVVDIFLIGDKRGKLPNPAFPRKMKKFYDAVSSIMTYHLQTLCLKSLYDYTEYITDIYVRFDY